MSGSLPPAPPGLPVCFPLLAPSSLALRCPWHVPCDGLAPSMSFPVQSCFCSHQAPYQTRELGWGSKNMDYLWALQDWIGKQWSSAQNEDPGDMDSVDFRGPVAELKILGRSHTSLLSSDESLDMIDNKEVVEKILEEGQSLEDHHWQNRSVLEWNCQQVSHWLMGLSLEQYVPAFTAKNIDGEHLLQMDSSSLKDLGVVTSQDRALIKKKARDLKAIMEKARKNREKLEKHREKLRGKETEQMQKLARKGGGPSGAPAGGAVE